MPIYEYKCENDHVFDMLQKMADDPLTECIKCGAPVRKILQPVGISFKGSGFYSTDYKKKRESPKKTEPASSANGDSGGKSDSKDKSAPKSEGASSGKSTKKD